MIELVTDCEDWIAGLPDSNQLAARCFSAAVQLEPDLEGDIALLLTDDNAMQALNNQFRGKNAPTNVLSFPADKDVDGVDGGERFVGDIALAFETCAGEATARNIPLPDHVAHLIVHGMLHLIGYDHQGDEDATEMEQREREILATLNIDDPYGEELEEVT